MFKVTLSPSNQVLGPFKSVTDVGDALEADGVRLPKTALGAHAVGTWTTDPYTALADAARMESLKQEYARAANEARDKAEQAGFTYLNKQFDSDPVSVSRISIAALAAMAAKQNAQQFSVNWVAKDNSTVTLDADGMLGLMQALAVNGMTLHAQATAAKDAIKTATTPDQAAAGLSQAPKAPGKP